MRIDACRQLPLAISADCWFSEITDYLLLVSVFLMSSDWSVLGLSTSGRKRPRRQHALMGIGVESVGGGCTLQL